MDPVYAKVVAWNWPYVF